MNKYLLDTEKKKIDYLTEELYNSLNQNNLDLTNIKNEFTNIITHCKDYNIEDIINYYFTSLINKLSPLLEENITPALQFGIKTDNFLLTAFGGKYNKYNNSPNINENTFFSFDSISKIITSTITMQEIRNNNLTLNTKLNEYNNNLNLDTSIESILKFTAHIRTEKRIENLSQEETISILKKCKENLEEKKEYKNFYEYNDIGFMILRLSINNFLDKLDNLISTIDKNNLTYKNLEQKENITGGKLTEEFITQDQKGRSIPFPGHTGLYGNITGLLNLFNGIIFTESILYNKEKEQLFKQPYIDPIVYNKDGSIKVGKKKLTMYTAKIAGIYRKPKGITEENYNKLVSCDMSNYTTDNSKSAAGTCGSWVTGDDLLYNNKFGIYVSGLLTNPYSFTENKEYPNDINNIPNTPHQVNKKGKILGYHSRLNEYKEILTEYSLILELITEYIKDIDEYSLDKSNKKYIRKII